MDNLAKMSLIFIFLIFIFNKLVFASAILTDYGIIINGANNTLQSINDDINNASIFYYNNVTKEAISNANITVNQSGALIINNETLKFNATFNGQYYLKVNFNGSDVMGGNSNLTIFNRSYITVVNTSNQIGWVVYNNSNLIIEDSKWDNVGWRDVNYQNGLWIEANNCTIKNNNITVPNMIGAIGLILYPANNCNISGNEINIGYNAYYGIYFYNSHNNNVINNTIKPYKLGIYLYNSSNNSFINNTIYSLNDQNIYINSGSNNNITNNNLTGKVNGINLLSVNNSFIVNNIIKTNDVSGQSGAGIRLRMSSSRNKIINNTISTYPTQSYQHGIWLSDANDNLNEIINNTINVYQSYPSNGIYLESNQNNTIINNNISTYCGEAIYLKYSLNNNLINNNIKTSSCSSYVIRLYDSDNNIVDNNTAIGLSGFSLEQNSEKNNITNNVINASSNYGFVISNSINNIINNNQINTSSLGISLSSSYGNNFTNNTIRIFEGYPGIDIYSSYNNKFSYNFINVTKTGSSAYGILIRKNSYNITFKSNRIYSKFQGIRIEDNTRANFTNDTIYSCISECAANYIDIYLKDNASATFLNVSFNKSSVEFGSGINNLTVRWYLDVFVQDENLQPVPNATVNITDLSGTKFFSGNTSSDGYIATREIVEYFANGNYYYGTYCSISTNLTCYTPHTIIAYKYNYTDSASVNINMSKTIILTLAPPPPNVTLINPSNNSYDNDGIVTFNCSAMQDIIQLANITLYGNWSGGWHANETKNVSGTSNSTIFTKNLPDGTYVWNCLAHNNGTRSNWGDANYTITIDTITPVVSINSPTNENPVYKQTGQMIIINYTYTEANPANATLRLLNQSFAVINYTIITNLAGGTATRVDNITIPLDISDGRYHVNVTIEDLASNIGTTQQNNATFIDTTAPVVNLEGPENNSLWNLSLVVFTYNVSDMINVPNCTLYVDGIAKQTKTNIIKDVSQNFTLTINEDYHNWSIKCYDNANNLGSSITWWLNVSYDAITTTLTSPTNNTYTSIINQTFSCNVIDNEGFELINVTIYIWNSTDSIIHTETKNISGTSNSSIFSYNFTYDDIFKWNCLAYDNINNTGWAKNWSITIDTTYPIITYVAPTENNNTYFNRDWIAVNVSVIEANEANITFSLYNTTSLVNTTSSVGLRFVNWTVPDGIYYFNVTIVDKVNFTNSTITRVQYIDNAPPIVISKSKNNARQYKSVNLTINLIDETTNVQSVIARITYPNGSSINYTMSNNGSLWNLTLINLGQIGDYDINYTFNDTVGNVNTTTDWFEVYIPQNFTGNFIDYAGNAVYLTVKLYKPNTSKILYNFSANGSYSFTQDEIHSRLYDVEVDAFTHTIRLYSINFTNLSNPFTIDNLSTNKVNIDTYKPLVAIAVNTSLKNNATITLVYTGKFDPDSFPAVNESGLTVHKCGAWNYSARSCEGNWESVSNLSIDIDNDRITFNVSSFSAYVVTELRCGNNICEAAYGETTSSCPADCQETTTSTSGGGVGSGGGGGSAIIQPTVKPPPFQVSINKIEKKLLIGQIATELISIINNKDTPITLNIELTGQIKDYVILPVKELEIKPNSIKNIYLTIFGGTKEETVYGSLLIYNEINHTIPITLEIIKEIKKLLDLSAEVISKEIAPGETFRVKIIMYNMGTASRYDVILQYNIINLDTNEIILTKQETFAIETSLSLIREFLIPNNIPDGDYVLNINATYDELSAFAVAPFQVKKTFLYIIPKEIRKELPFIIFSIIIVFIIFIIAYSYIYLRKKKEEKILEEKKKESIYVWPDFKLLPTKLGAAWIGHVADSDVKAYIDLEQLNMHTLIAGGTGSGKTISGMVIVEEALEKGIPVIVFDPTGQWTGFIHKCTDSKMKACYAKFKMNKSKARGFKANIVEIENPKIKIDLTYYMYYMKKGMMIFVLNKLTPSELDTFIFNSLDQIYRMGLPESTKLKVLIVMDEIHRLLPKYGGKKAYVKVEQAVREFRKWGIGLVMISQVLTDFKGAIRGNIATEIQMRTKYEGDIKRINTKYGARFSRLISRLPTGVGMIQNPAYNNGNPYFVEFRPLWHSPLKLTESMMKNVSKKARLLPEEKPKKEEKKLITIKHVKKIREKSRIIKSKILKHKKKKNIFLKSF